MDHRELLDFVAPKLHPVGDILVARPDLDAVAPHAELARGELDVVPLVLDVDQRQHVVAVGRSHRRPTIIAR
jgi:hypothetical protein